jgi:hypothetical protein
MFDPVSLEPGWNTILQLAGNDACLAVKTFGCVYHHGIFGLHTDLLISSIMAAIQRNLSRVYYPSDPHCTAEAYSPIVHRVYGREEGLSS